MENLSFTTPRFLSVSVQHSPSGTPFISTSGQPHATIVHLLTTPDKTQTALGVCLQFYPERSAPVSASDQNNFHATYKWNKYNYYRWFINVHFNILVFTQHILQLQRPITYVISHGPLFQLTHTDQHPKWLVTLQDLQEQQKEIFCMEFVYEVHFHWPE